MSAAIDVAKAVQALATAVLSMMVTSTLWSLVPLAIGLHSDVVMSGSMTPRIRPGDVVISARSPVADLRPGQVIVFTDPDSAADRRMIHRYVRRNSDGTLVTKGDANTEADRAPVPPALLRGLARVRIPLVGLPAYWARTGQWLRLAGVVLALFALVGVATARTPGSAGLGSPPTAARPRPAPGCHRARGAPRERPPGNPQLPDTSADQGASSAQTDRMVDCSRNQLK